MTKVYLVSPEWSGSMHRKNMRIFDDISLAINYLADEIGFFIYNWVALNNFRFYEFDLNQNTKPVILNKYIEEHFVVI